LAIKHQMALVLYSSVCCLHVLPGYDYTDTATAAADDDDDVQ